MSIKVVVKETSGWFIGENKELAFPVTDAIGTPLDVSAWTIAWALMKRPSADDYLLFKQTGPGGGIRIEEGPEAVDNVIVVDIDDDDLVALRAGAEYYQELKRMDVGDEGVLAYGPVTLLLSGIPELLP